MKLPVDKSKLIDQLIKQEDTTGSHTITIDDLGKKEFFIENEEGNSVLIKGTYHLSNLLQEAALLTNHKGNILLEHIVEEPVTRTSRVIKDYYWDKLTRSFDNEGVLNVLEDEKMQGDFLRLYVPESDVEALEFYKQKTMAYGHVKVETIPENISNEEIIALNQKPGILALAYSKEKKKSIPFVVPGGRFNEMYGWDSYFIGLGLIIDDKFELAQAMIDNLEYQIIHYGKILNANRSYYLSRSQPPFFTSFIKEFYETYSNKLQLNWLQQKLTTAISEYFNVWMTENVRLTDTQLNRYFGEGTGVPNETEPEHFDAIFKIFAKKHNIPFIEFKEKYKQNEIVDEALDKYFVHDRSMRESGHDTTNRLDDCSAHLNSVDLNSLLYKYETDIAYLIASYFNDSFSYNNNTFSSAEWLQRANKRKQLMIGYMWNEKESVFYDYNFVKKKQQPCISTTNLYPLWTNLCTEEQAESIVKKQLPNLICKGGLASTSGLEAMPKDATERQWDFPYGWAPHQMLIWQGLKNYGFETKAQELIYRWLWLIVKTAVNYNGLIPEKFDVNTCTHQVDVEYGNVGTNFKYVTDGGFGWTNASYKLGIELLEAKYLNSLNMLTDPDSIFPKST
ncbi:trehalase family glycosidase [Flavivirga spongiicola]|uniref:Alpha,alpha-trehalase n=1 Tax=Flavivirga spongiicola TaxID=421621 RepID=A0ABU7XUH4_9FLAO|nr:trehalase family glycosidase [Flavivirga sp. MEBiC05379]MDO5979432.1 trehalase family glycosidase [Flavivirga sp. MEBiC05379]